MVYKPSAFIATRHPITSRPISQSQTADPTNGAKCWRHATPRHAPFHPRIPRLALRTGCTAGNPEASSRSQAEARQKAPPRAVRSKPELGSWVPPGLMPAD